MLRGSDQRLALPRPANKKPGKRCAVGLMGLTLWLATLDALSLGAGRVDFDRDIRPLLADRCFACHGPDHEQRQADLRLDSFEGATAKLSSGGQALVPGDRAASLLLTRIAANDPDLRMPPPDHGKPLTSEEIELFGLWVDQGASWSQHWSFVTPVRLPPPRFDSKSWPRGVIDSFVLDRLDRERIDPSPEADRPTLIRRVCLDLTGLPPTADEVETFLADSRPDAYERLVDRLLASPRFGERLALPWLDAARYADTNGYQIDNSRDMWAWRDWVINAFNQNMPFDQFTVEQLAGDLIPGATPDQRIASGFNRNHPINFEGGSIAEEFRTVYVVDRVNTTATVWMGLTVGCAQCHDHKYDPITQEDFYRLFAFFNSIAEKGIDGLKGNAVPLIDVPSSQTTVMVMQEMEQPRETFILVRGQYDQPGRRVAPGVLDSLPRLSNSASPSRLGLARWLVDPDHPLTARVTVNRFWQMMFGTGLVTTAEDFGNQGDRPSHPKLLDWLAVELVESGWDIKQLLRRLVTSAVYRQRSDGSDTLNARDPANRLLARGPRFRMSAEAIRDVALAVSGLLVEKIGGPSVKPYQPPGLWRELAMGNPGGEDKRYTAQFYVQDHGEKLFRRSLYVFRKRAAPPPALAAFDAPNRVVCTMRRQRTNTPLQALVLLNDPTFVEAARCLAQRALRADAGRFDVQVRYAFRLVTSRWPSAKEVEILQDVYRQQVGLFRADPAAAQRLLTVGESRQQNAFDVVEHAAWTMVASLILNLDEAITKQ